MRQSVIMRPDVQEQGAVTRPSQTLLADPSCGIDTWLWLGPLLYASILALYFLGRFGGQWAENDSAAFSQTIRAFIGQDRLVPLQGPIYTSGYTFQTIAAFLVALTGLSVADLQRLASPVLAALVILPAWAFYREVTGSARGAAIGSVLLFMQPEFLFVILRSSHEKFTRTLMLLSLYLLVRSFRLGHRPAALVVHVVLFHVSVFVLIGCNLLLASSFIGALAIAVALAVAWSLISPGIVRLARPLNGRFLMTISTRWLLLFIGRFLITVSTCWLLLFISLYWVYPPSQAALDVATNIIQRVGEVAISSDQMNRTAAYAQVGSAWIHPAVYFITSIANWVILAAASIIAVRQGVLWLVGRSIPNSAAAWFRWLLFAAFVLQVVLTVVADASGATLASNLQHRFFPSLSIGGVALVAAALARWQPRRGKQPIQLAMAAMVFVGTILCVFKVTNEPLLSNTWTFYSEHELIGLRWADRHLAYANIATDFNERIIVAYETRYGSSLNKNSFRWYGDETANWLVTVVTRLRSTRLGHPLPLPHDALQVYDNGETQFYHARPHTPYQP